MHPLLIEGLSDAIGFVGGALAGYWIAQALGWNPFAEGYGAGSIGGIALVGRAAEQLRRFIVVLRHAAAEGAVLPVEGCLT